MLTYHKYATALSVWFISQAACSFDAFYEELPVVLTPARLAQPLSDTPASVTVITRETIQKIGATDILDVLRVIPGIAIMHRGDNNVRVAYHSGNRSHPRRLQFLIDGVPAYGLELAAIDWLAFPVGVDDIERVEVTRSPSTAVYGTNAFNGVINFITRNPRDAEGVVIKVGQGSLNHNSTRLSFGKQFGDTSLHISGNQMWDNGIDLPDEYTEDNHDDRKTRNLKFDLSTRLNEYQDIDISYTYFNGVFQKNDVASDLNELTYPDIEKTQNIISIRHKLNASEKFALNTKLSTYTTDKRQEWVLCAPLLLVTEELADIYVLNQALTTQVLAGETPTPQTLEEIEAINRLLLRIATLGGPTQALAETCGDINENSRQSRSNIETEATYVFSDALRIVAAAGYTHTKIKSETLFQGETTNLSHYLLMNIEYRPNQYLTINAGGITENESDSDEEFSPRAALNFHFTPKHTVRLIHSKAIRTPDLLEQHADIRYLLRNLTLPLDGANEAPIAIRVQAQNNLSPERITANEISYFGNIPEARLRIDIKLFKEKLENLIAENLTLRENTFSNNAKTNIQGFEAEIEYQPVQRVNTRIGYSNFSYSSNNEKELNIAVDETLYANASFEISDSTFLTTAYYYSRPTQEDRKLQTTEIADLNLTSQYQIAPNMFVLGNAKIRHYLADDSFDKRNLYKNDTQYFVNIELKYQF